MHKPQSDDCRGPNETLWRNAEDDRRFIVPEGRALTEGDYGIRSLAGAEAQVDLAWLVRYEVTPDEATAWAQQEFAIALAEVRRRINSKLGRMRTALDTMKHAPVRPGGEMAPNSLPAMLLLAGALPRAIFDGLSGDPVRVSDAQDRLGSIERRLNEAGVDVGDRLSAFPLRLAELRTETVPARGRAGAPPSEGGER